MASVHVDTLKNSDERCRVESRRRLKEVEGSGSRRCSGKPLRGYSLQLIPSFWRVGVYPVKDMANESVRIFFVAGEPICLPERHEVLMSIQFPCEFLVSRDLWIQVANPDSSAREMYAYPARAPNANRRAYRNRGPGGREMRIDPGKSHRPRRWLVLRKPDRPPVTRPTSRLDSRRTRRKRLGIRSFMANWKASASPLDHSAASNPVACFRRKSASACHLGTNPSRSRELFAELRTPNRDLMC